MFASIALWLCLSQTATSDDAAKWLSANAVPLKTVVAGNGLADMEPLKASLEGVDVVGMGECTHGSREVFQMKHRMFEFLVERMGFTVFAIESSMPGSAAMDRFVTEGKGDASDAVKAQRFWTWLTEEVRDLILWMRKYNEDKSHTRKLRVVGIDMQSRIGAAYFLKEELMKAGAIEDDGSSFLSQASAGKSENLEAVDKKVQAALPKIADTLGSEEAELVKRVLQVLHQAEANERVSEFRRKQAEVSGFLMETVKNAGALLKQATDLDADGRAGLDLLDRSSRSVVDLKLEGKANLRKYAASVRAFAQGRTDDKTAFERAARLLEYFADAYDLGGLVQANYRDQCMAENLEWVTKTYLPGQKVMVWAHNGHIGRTRIMDRPYAMGAHLEAIFGPRYFPVGFAFYEGSFQARGPGGGELQEWTVKPAPADSLEAVLKKAGPSPFFADFGKMDAKTKAWMDEKRPTRSIGALYDPQNAGAFLYPAETGKLFRGLIFISKTTRARPLK